MKVLFVKYILRYEGGPLNSILFEKRPPECSKRAPVAVKETEI